MKIVFKQASVQLGGKSIIHPFDLSINHAEQWAFIGSTGSGKSSLAKAIANLIFFHGNIEFYNELNESISPAIQLIEQQHAFKNKSNVSQFYYQQRFNSNDAEETFTVKEYLCNHSIQLEEKWVEKLNIASIIEKPMIQLSNGEHKRLQIMKAVTQNPDLIILDNPYVGLDQEGRNVLSELLNEITCLGKKIILITAPHNLPSCITNIGILKDGQIKRADAKVLSQVEDAKTNAITLSKSIIDAFKQNTQLQFELAVSMKNVSIAYHQKSILKHINWEVRKGQRWSISGHNGSGKSTLISLITADNPQAFAHEIYLFDNRKGSGESIWEIKKNIGFVSPELHLYFEKSFTAFEVVASGLFDTIGLFRKTNKEQDEMISAWMDLLNIAELKSLYLNQLSLGQQRMVMIARALVKAPPLLILDEPCQGLDKEQIEYFKTVIDQVTAIAPVTVIYISHYKEDIPTCIDHWLHLSNGAIDHQKSTL